MKAWQNNASSNTISTQRKLTTSNTFENLFKPRQCRLAVCMLLTSSVSSTTSKQCFELTSSVLSTTSKQCFEQPAASFLVCSLIFIEYK